MDFRDKVVVRIFRMGLAKIVISKFCNRSPIFKNKTVRLGFIIVF
ncbi:hypothetical protein LEP1GSC172_1606 [Leptospira noguchii]|uniref:Uncharacterized protein n=1 Tax=Leptospira noguchii TaxID=28182 RepID=M6VCD8_9LEPT|nr:hypothetical protein LEP1GSC172_1606 [Leptospira noguchii]